MCDYIDDYIDVLITAQHPEEEARLSPLTQVSLTSPRNDNRANRKTFIKGFTRFCNFFVFGSLRIVQVI